MFPGAYGAGAAHLRVRPHTMRLRFPGSEITYWASRFAYSRKEDKLLSLRRSIQQAGYLSKPQLRLLAQWKAPRSAQNVSTNTPSYIREVTAFALTAHHERARIETLTVLDGVRWPTASAVLHFFHKDKYPILDFRALWSVGLDVPAQYSFDFWQPYVEFCRLAARRNSVSMREFDKALWQYSKENQPPPRKAEED